MMPTVRRYHWRLTSAGLLFVVVVGAWLGSRWPARAEGSAEDVFSRIRVGMSQREAVAVLRSYKGISGLYSSGVAKGGRGWDRLHVEVPFFDELPPPHEIASCILVVVDDEGRELEVTLG